MESASEGGREAEAKREHVAGFWDEYARDSEGSVLRAPRSQLQPALLGFAQTALRQAAVAPGSTVVDIATGAGSAALVLAEAGMHVHAVDFAETWVRLVASYGIPNVVVSQMNGESLDLPEKSFDAAFSLFGVTLFNDWRAGLTEMYRVVRPGGKVAVGTWASPGGACGARALALLCDELFTDVPQPEMLPGIAATLTEPDLRAELERAGFVNVTIVHETRDCELDRDELEAPDRLFAFSSQWAHLDAQQRARVVEVMKSRCRDDELYLVPSPAMIATADRPAV